MAPLRFVLAANDVGESLGRAGEFVSEVRAGEATEELGRTRRDRQPVRDYGVEGRHQRRKECSPPSQGRWLATPRSERLEEDQSGDCQPAFAEHARWLRGATFADAHWARPAHRSGERSERLAKLGGEGGIRTHVPLTRQDAFEAPPLRPLRYLSATLNAQFQIVAEAPVSANTTADDRRPMADGRVAVTCVIKPSAVSPTVSAARGKTPG